MTLLDGPCAGDPPEPLEPYNEEQFSDVDLGPRAGDASPRAFSEQSPRPSDPDDSSSDESSGSEPSNVPGAGESGLALRPARYFVDGWYPTRDYRPEGYAPGTISTPQIDMESLKLLFLDTKAANRFLIRYLSEHCTTVRRFSDSSLAVCLRLFSVNSYPGVELPDCTL